MSTLIADRHAVLPSRFAWLMGLYGENYHRHWDGELCRRDQIRSRRLGDAGWDIMRFWVYEIRDDLEGCIERVKAWMDGR